MNLADNHDSRKLSDVPKLFCLTYSILRYIYPDCKFNYLCFGALSIERFCYTNIEFRNTKAICTAALNKFTHCILVDSSTVICCMSPLVNLGVPGPFCCFYCILM